MRYLPGHWEWKRECINSFLLELLEIGILVVKFGIWKKKKKDLINSFSVKSL